MKRSEIYKKAHEFLFTINNRQYNEMVQELMVKNPEKKIYNYQTMGQILNVDELHLDQILDALYHKIDVHQHNYGITTEGYDALRDKYFLDKADQAELLELNKEVLKKTIVLHDSTIGLNKETEGIYNHQRVANKRMFWVTISLLLASAITCLFIGLQWYDNRVSSQQNKELKEAQLKTEQSIEKLMHSVGFLQRQVQNAKIAKPDSSHN